MTKRLTSEIDMMAAKFIARRRVEMGMTRAQLSSKIGVTHQQLQKYERGTNRVSIGRLDLLARALKTSVSAFFPQGGNDDMPDQRRRMAMEVSRNFMRIKNPEQQAVVSRLIKSMVDD